MKVSIIVAVYNRIDFIDPCVESILAQDFDNFELVIVDDGSTDGTRQAIQKYGNDPRVIIHENPRNLGLCASRNAGFKVGTGDIIAYTDSDCVVKPNWIRELVQPFLDQSDVMIAGGRVLDPNPRNYWERVNRGLCFLSGSSGYISRIIGCNMAFRRSFLDKNPFDTNLRYAGDELDLCLKCAEQNYKLFYNHAAEVIHHHRSSMLSSYWQQYRYRYECNYIFQKHGMTLFRTPYPLWWIPIVLIVLTLEWMWMNSIYGFAHLYHGMPLCGILLGVWMLHRARMARNLGWSDVVVCIPGYCILIIARGMGWLKYLSDKTFKGKTTLFQQTG